MAGFFYWTNPRFFATLPCMKILVTLLIICLLPLPAFSDEMQERVGRLERTLELLQRKLLSQGASSPLPSSSPLTLSSPDTGASAAFELRISTIEEQLRDLRGMIEQLEYRQQRQEVEMQKMSEDVEFRFQQFASTNKGAEIPSSSAEATQTSQENEVPNPAMFDPATQAAQQAAETLANGGFATPRALYDHAFKRLGSGQYADAAESFSRFIREHPEDPLVGNAYYWLGETYYVRSDYVRAAEQFRLGFEALPKGPKSKDNLLKLAMSLSQIQKEKEACVVLKQLTKSGTDTSETIRRRANAGSERIACK